MFERFLEWWRGPTVIILEITEPDPPDLDRLAELIESGATDIKSMEEMARLFGQADPERF
jgi:hypothetical protein